MPPAFAALAEAARAAGKGIVCIKSGKTELSRTAAASHTASLAGGGAASSAFLRQVGVAEVQHAVRADRDVEDLSRPRAADRDRGCARCPVRAARRGWWPIWRRLIGHRLPAGPAGDARPAVRRTGRYSGRSSHRQPAWTITPSSGATGRARPKSSPRCLAAYDAGIFIIDPPRPDRCDPFVAMTRPWRPSWRRKRPRASPPLPVASLPENFERGRGPRR